VDLVGRLSLSLRSRNFFPLLSDTWKVIFQCYEIELHFSFLLKSHKNAARVVPKDNRIVSIFVEKNSKIKWNSNRLQLVCMSWQIKNVSYSVHNVSDNNNSFDIWEIYSLIYTTSNQKHFCFCGCNIYHMINSFLQNTLTRQDVGYGCCDIILDTSISNNKDNFWI